MKKISSKRKNKKSKSIKKSRRKSIKRSKVIRKNKRSRYFQMVTPPVSRKNSGELEEKEDGEITWEEKTLGEIFQENIYKEKSTAELLKLLETFYLNKKDIYTINTFIYELLSRDGITFRKLYDKSPRILSYFRNRKRSNNRKYFSLYTIFIPKEFRVEFEQMDYPNDYIQNQLNTLTIKQLGILLATILNTEQFKFRLNMIDEIADELKRRGVVLWKIMSILKGENTIEILETLDIFIPPFCHNDECSICSLPFNVKESVRYSCNHCFHKNCIKKWLSLRKKNCPICAKPIYKQSGYYF